MADRSHWLPIFDEDFFNCHAKVHSIHLQLGLLFNAVVFDYMLSNIIIKLFLLEVFSLQLGGKIISDQGMSHTFHISLQT